MQCSTKLQCSAHSAGLKVQSSNAFSFTLGVGMITDAFLLRGGRKVCSAVRFLTRQNLFNLSAENFRTNQRFQIFSCSLLVPLQTGYSTCFKLQHFALQKSFAKRENGNSA